MLKVATVTATATTPAKCLLDDNKIVNRNYIMHIHFGEVIILFSTEFRTCNHPKKRNQIICKSVIGIVMHTHTVLLIRNGYSAICELRWTAI